MFLTSSGAVVLTDLMPVRDAAQSLMVPDHEIVRQVTCTSGEVEMETELAPRSNYGETNPPMHDCGKLGIRIDNGYGVYWLRSGDLNQVAASKICRLELFGKLRLDRFNVRHIKVDLRWMAGAPPDRLLAS